VHAVQYGLWILSWWLLGRGALAGRLDRGWLLAWILLLLTLVPLRILLLGLRPPDSGLVLLGELDRHTLGAAG
jgi:hypothetical protein